MKNLIILLTLFSIVLFGYVLYKDIIIYDGNRREYYYPYYLFTVIFIILNIIILKFKKIRIYYFISIFTSLICVYGFEGYHYINIINKFDENRKSYIETLEKYKSLKPVPAFTKFLRNSEKIHFFSGLPNRFTIHCNELGYWSTYNSDRYGFNNIDRKWDKEIEIIFLGDSFTHGQCVDQGNDISSKFSSISKMNSINLGWGGNGLLSSLGSYVEYGENRNSKFVVLNLYLDNDYLDTKKESENNILINYLDLNFKQNLIKKKLQLSNSEIETINQSKIKKEIEIEEYNFKKRFFINFLKMNNTRMIFTNFFKMYNYKKKDANYLSNQYNFFLKTIFNIKKRVELENSKFLIVFIPKFNEYSLTFNKQEINEEKNFKQICLDKNIHCLFLRDKINSEIKDYLSIYPNRSSGHFNEKGYDFVAKKIYEKILEINND